jgi:hypothetical protein
MVGLYRNMDFNEIVERQFIRQSLFRALCCISAMGMRRRVTAS